MDNTARGASDNGSESAILDDVGMPPDDDNQQQQQPNGSSLDHALLESIFYNEMALLDDFSEAFFASNGSYNSSTSSVSSGLGGASTPTTTTAANTLQGSGAAVASRNEAATVAAAAPTTAVSNTIVPDPTVAVEKDLLRDFGVAHSLSPALLLPVGSSLRHPATGSSLSPPPPPATTLPFVPPPINVEEQRRNLQALAGRGRGIRHNVVAKAAAATTTSAAVVPTTTRTMDLAAVAAVAAAGTTVADAGAVTGATGALAPMDTADKRSKLVAQFATLAGRLGITLPPQVLHKLTAPNTTASSNSKGALETNEDILVDVTESSRKRPHEDMESSSSSPRQSQAPAAAAAAAAKPYSKRRKKPRLSDCEQKLALLQAEQALLQSQVAQMANRNETLNQERLAAECKMRTMLHDPQSTPEQLDQAVQEFSDLYSDYGRKRHEELLFHLEQLQRYVYARSECAGMCAQFLFMWATHAQMTVVFADFPTPPTLPKWVCGPWAVADKTRLQHSRHPTRAILVTLAAQLSRVTRYPPATLLP
jgi:hypothetical protein